jgi:tetratricopeptide (TPR) repeat protein
MRITYSIGLFLIVVTLAIFWQIRNHEFVWNDRNAIVENLSPNRRAPSNGDDSRQGSGLQLSNPLTHAVWATVAGLSENPTADPSRKPDPRPFHIANLIVHILSVLVVFAILRLLIHDDWAAGSGALLFALHPLQVEPVAWATGMRELLCGFLSLISLWQYVKYALPVTVSAPADRAGGTASQKRLIHKRRFSGALAIFAFALAVLANPAAVALPVVAFVIDYVLFKRSLRHNALSLGACVTLAVVVIGVTQWARLQNLGGISPIWQRPLIAADALTFYLYKLFVPFQLSVDYGRSPVVVAQQGWIYLTWLVPVALGLLLWLSRRRAPYFVCAASIFAASLLPFLGLFPFRFQTISTVADRYLYLAMLGPAFALAWVVSRWQTKPVLMACGILLAALGLKSAFQARLWRNNVILFSHALELNSNSWISHYNIGVDLARKGAFEDAAQHYRAALKIKPDYVSAHFRFGNILAVQGNLDEAIRQYDAILKTGPVSAAVHYNLGNAFAVLNRLTEAVEQYEKSLQLDPASAAAHGGLGHVLFKQNKLEDALEHYRKAIEIDPEAADVHYSMATILGSRGEIEPAMDHYRVALRLNPTYSGAYYNVGILLARRGRLDEAIGYFRQALAIRPDFVEAHESLGRALVLQGNREEGLKHIEQALQILKIGHGAETAR